MCSTSYNRNKQDLNQSSGKYVRIHLTRMTIILVYQVNTKNDQTCVSTGCARCTNSRACVYKQEKDIKIHQILKKRCVVRRIYQPWHLYFDPKLAEF